MTDQIKVEINQAQFELPEHSTLENALQLYQAQAPFAVMLNEQFIPKFAYAQTPLADKDRIDIVSPIQGG